MSNLEQLKRILSELNACSTGNDWLNDAILGMKEDIKCGIEHLEEEAREKRVEQEKQSLQNQLWLYRQIRKMVEAKRYADPGLGITHAHLVACLDRMLVLLGTASEDSL